MTFRRVTPRVPTSGKEFSSDPIGDGPGHGRSTAWVHLLGPGVTHAHSRAYTVIRNGQTDARILQRDIDQLVGSATLPTSQIEPLLHHFHVHHEPWITLLHQLYLEDRHTEGLHAFVYLVLLSAMTALQKKPDDHFLVQSLHSTPISDLGGLELKEATVLPLLDSLHLRVTVF